MLNGIILSLLLFACILAFQYYGKYRKGIQRVSNYPGFRTLISPMSMAGFGTPRIPGIYPGFDMPWRGKHRIFSEVGSDVITCVSINGRSILYLADADLIAKINGDRYSYPKPVEEYTVLNYFGPNLVTAEGMDWRDQHLVSAPAFDLLSLIYLWNECLSIFNNMLQFLGWRDVPVGQDIKVDHVVDITLQMALLAIANAGFGMHSSWGQDITTALAPGHTMSFMTALHIVAQSSILKLALPKWACYLPIPRIRRMQQAFRELELYIQEMIAELKLEIARPNHTPRDDLFYRLVRQNMYGDVQLTDEQLQGNIYIFLLAGHETTAHSMAFMLACLALWPDAQERMYAHIVEVIGDQKTTSYDDYRRLWLVQAGYSETLRMFPPVQQIPKILKKDTIFVFDRSNEHNAAIGLEDAARRQAKQEASASFRASDSSFMNHPSVDSIRAALSANSTASTSDTHSTLSPSAYPPSFDHEPELQLPGAFLLDNSSTGPSTSPPPTLLRNPSNCRPISKRVITTQTPEQQSLLVEKDTIVFVDPPAVHYNPKYYPDPEEYIPERFAGNFDKTTFLPFSSGTRACLGRQFSEVESVAYMAHLLLEFSVHPTPAYEGETREEMKERMFKAIPLISLTPLHIPLTFRRRPPPPARA